MVIGNNCPAGLLPHQTGIASNGKADLLMLAPSPDECAAPGWLQEVLGTLADRLSKDGVGYLLVPRRSRIQIERRLSSLGLCLETAIGHFPNSTSNQYLMPFDSGTTQFAFSTLIPSAAWKRFLSRQILRLPGVARVLPYAWPSVGLVVRHPGARPLFEWLFRLEKNNPGQGYAIIRSSWRGENGPILVYQFLEQAAKPAAVAKLTSPDRDQEIHLREAQALRQLGPAASQAGAQIPEILAMEQLGPRSVLLETAVSGRRVDHLLQAHPERLLPILGQLTGWLKRWQRLTMHLRQVDGEQLEEILLAPARLLAPFLEQGEAYQRWLDACSHSLLGNRLPFSAAHQDLTMANILLDETGRLAIVDWETSEPQSWPLVDFYYAITDAILEGTQAADRLEAFRAGFTPGGLYTAYVTRLQSQLTAALDLDPNAMQLCLHACWLHHAANELKTSRPGSPRPFLEIVQWLATSVRSQNVPTQ